MTRPPTPMERACDAWLELRYQGVDGPSHDVTTYVDSIAAAIQRAVDAAVAEEREACAETCIMVWKDAPNDRPEYRQNMVSHGCSASARAIRDRSVKKEGEGDANP